MCGRGWYLEEVRVGPERVCVDVTGPSEDEDEIIKALQLKLSLIRMIILL